jgi:hypothetical protein
VGGSERHYGWGEQNISSVLKVPRHCPFVLFVSVSMQPVLLKFNFLYFLFYVFNFYFFIFYYFCFFFFSFTCLYADDVRTSQEAEDSTSCYGDSFTCLYVDDVRTSQEAQDSTAFYGDSFTCKSQMNFYSNLTSVKPSVPGQRGFAGDADSFPESFSD